MAGLGASVLFALAWFKDVSRSPVHNETEHNRQNDGVNNLALCPESEVVRQPSGTSKVMPKP